MKIIKKKTSIGQLFQEFELLNPELANILRSIRKMVLEIAPASKEEIMYGGIIYSIPERMFCGLFLRKKHISVEFDLGFLLEDEEMNLEGTGKYRRHLKIHDEEELIEKKVEKYIKASYNLQT